MLLRKRNFLQKGMLLLFLITGVFGVASAEDGIAPKEDTLVNFSTEHFDVKLAKQYEKYRPEIEKYLEQGYKYFQGYTGYDLNVLMDRINPEIAPDIHHPRYLYMFYMPENMWWKGWRGGLTAWNLSQACAEMLPGLETDKIKAGDKALSIIWHELGNGWANLYVNYKGYPVYTPWWFAAEGHAGFLRQHAMIDAGWTVEQVREYGTAVAAYDDYMKGEKYDEGGVCHVFVQSLWAEYGWGIFRPVYAAIQNGELTFIKGDSLNNDSILVRFISEKAGNNLLLFFEKFKIKVNEDTEKALSKLPKKDIPIERNALATPRNPLTVKK